MVDPVNVDSISRKDNNLQIIVPLIEPLWFNLLVSKCLLIIV